MAAVAVVCDFVRHPGRLWLEMRVPMATGTAEQSRGTHCNPS